MFSEPMNNLFQSQNHSNEQDHVQRLTLSNHTAANDVTLNSPDLFKVSPAQTQSLSESLQSKSSDLFKGKEDDLFQAAKGDGLLQAAWVKEVDPFDKSASTFVDPFTSLSNKENDLFQFPKPVVANPFSAAPVQETDLFHAAPTKQNKQDTPAKEKDPFHLPFKESLDIFSSSSMSAVDPFPSPIEKDLFRDVFSLDDPFGSTPSEKSDAFQDVSSGTPDIFQPLPSKSKNKVEMMSSNIDSNSSYFSLKSPSEMKFDVPTSPHLLKKSKTPPPVPRKPFQKPQEITLTTPQGTKHDILQPTPIIQARDLSASPSQSPAEMNNVQVFKRPLKPLPRIRHRRSEKSPLSEKPPRPEKPPQLESPSEPEPSVPELFPKPSFKHLKAVTRHKQNRPEIKPVESENYVVFEDILLIGQERCVEDWPDDSPQLDPEYKPSGKFRLRRESMRVQAESDGGSSEDQDRSHSKKKDKKHRMFLLSTRGSKGKLYDMKERKSSTLPLPRKSSQDHFSDVHMSAGEIDDEEQTWMDYKKNPSKTKVNKLLRRASTNQSVLEGKNLNGHSPLELKRTPDQSSVEDEEEGETIQREKKKTLKLKFVPRRGFVITSVKANDESKGVFGNTPRKDSKADMLDEHDPEQEKSSCCAEALGSDALNGVDGCKQKKFKPKHPIPTPRKPKTANGQAEQIGFSYLTPQQASKDEFAEDEMDEDFMSPGEMHDVDEQDELEFCKEKKPSKLKLPKKGRRKSKATYAEEDPPGATSSDYLSEAARAEWRAAQLDEQTLTGNEEEDEDGDTDSLMEWWNTVERWDEVPSDDEDMVMTVDDSRSFTILADKVHRGLRVFNKIFTERAEVLWESIMVLYTIADDINEFHQKAKIAGITGGTTTAVGSVTAIAGLALAPFTFGASLVITAVGVGVATAGGIASASAAISDNVNNMHDRKKVEIVLQEYETHLLDIRKILHFVNQGLYKLRGHPFLRSGTQHYSEDWEIRRAVQIISLVDSPVMRATDIADGAVASVQALFEGMDQYFTKDTRELKKGCKKEMVSQLRELAAVLNEAIMELNTIREELQEATGSI
ncbi:uncharacterized protein LOC115797292 isoform X2 [Archocentrus centrarchus]|nr:uncharacterized protein LOC115797292 isoform X2 [Archocentrus centrarchus]